MSSELPEGASKPSSKSHLKTQKILANISPNVTRKVTSSLKSYFRKKDHADPQESACSSDESSSRRLPPFRNKLALQDQSRREKLFGQIRTGIALRKTDVHAHADSRSEKSFHSDTENSTTYDFSMSDMAFDSDQHSDADALRIKLGELDDSSGGLSGSVHDSGVDSSNKQHIHSLEKRIFSLITAINKDKQTIAGYTKEYDKICRQNLTTERANICDRLGQSIKTKRKKMAHKEKSLKLKLSEIRKFEPNFMADDASFGLNCSLPSRDNFDEIHPSSKQPSYLKESSRLQATADFQLSKNAFSSTECLESQDERLPGSDFEGCTKPDQQTVPTINLESNAKESLEHERGSANSDSPQATLLLENVQRQLASLNQRIDMVATELQNTDAKVGTIGQSQLKMSEALKKLEDKQSEVEVQINVHQDIFSNGLVQMKQDFMTSEQKVEAVEYNLDGQVKDIHDRFEMLQNKLQDIEKEQHNQSVRALEVWEGQTPRILYGLLSVLIHFLVFCFNFIKIFTVFFNSAARMCISLLLLGGITWYFRDPASFHATTKYVNEHLLRDILKIS